LIPITPPFVWISTVALLDLPLPFQGNSSRVSSELPTLRGKRAPHVVDPERDGSWPVDCLLLADQERGAVAEASDERAAAATHRGDRSRSPISSAYAGDGRLNLVKP
jgi:hypothetical protein